MNMDSGALFRFIKHIWRQSVVNKITYLMHVYHHICGYNKLQIASWSYTKVNNIWEIAMQHKQLKHVYSRMKRIENVVCCACSDVDSNTYIIPHYIWSSLIREFLVFILYSWAFMLYLWHRAISNFAKLNSQICMAAMRKYIVVAVLWQTRYYYGVYYFNCSEGKCKLLFTNHFRRQLSVWICYDQCFSFVHFTHMYLQFTQKTYICSFLK